MLDEADLEGCVESLYQLARFADDEVAAPVRIATRLLGPGSIVRVPHLRELGHIARVSGEYVIAVRRGLARAREQHTIGHELAHWLFERDGYDGADLEDACDFVGAGLMTRRRPFTRRAREVSLDFRQLAHDFDTSETMVALRVGETLDVPVAVIAPLSVRVRGPEWGWPPPDQIRRLARAPVPGVRRAPLTDDRRRVALVGEAA